PPALYPLSLHDALPICCRYRCAWWCGATRRPIPNSSSSCGRSRIRSCRRRTARRDRTADIGARNGHRCAQFRALLTVSRVAAVRGDSVARRQLVEQVEALTCPRDLGLAAADETVVRERLERDDPLVVLGRILLHASRDGRVAEVEDRVAHRGPLGDLFG